MTRATTVLTTMVGGALLLWPAALNGYPILFSDTGGLLDMGLLPSMGWDKPFVYGPLLAAFSLRLTLALPVVAQTLLLSYLLLLLQRAYAVLTPSRHLLLCLAVTLLTAAPWFADTLMPDALTPIAALALILTASALPPAHRRAVTLIAAIAIASHLSHLILAAALIVAVALANRRIPWRALSSLAAALLFLVASNWIGNGRPSVSPYGSVFALARLIADGPARDYLDRTCPTTDWILCRWRSQLTDDSDQFLWAPDSPFWADPAPLPEFAAQAGRIVRGTIQSYPLRVLRNAYRNAAHQLIRADLGDTLGPDYLRDAVRPRIERFFPAAELNRFDAGRQTNGTLAPLAALPLQRAALLAGLAACTIILIAGFRRPSRRADLAALILVALAANAFATGALSTVHDRYQARLAWIIVLPPLLLTRSSSPPRVASAPTHRNPA